MKTKIGELSLTFQMLINLVEEAENSQQLTDSDLEALHGDRNFLNFAMESLDLCNAEAISGLWRKVQYISRFFGGDYLRNYNGRELDRLLEKVFNETLGIIVEIRGSSSET